MKNLLTLSFSINIFFFFLVCSNYGQSFVWEQYITGNPEVNEIINKGDSTIIATNAGLVIIDELKDSTYFFNTSNANLINNNIDNVAVDNNGNIWVSCYESFVPESNGLVRYDGKKWEQFTLKNGKLPTDYVLCFDVGSDNAVWIPDYHNEKLALYKYVNNNWVKYESDITFPSNSITTMTVEGNSEVWMGVFMGGLAHYSNTKFGGWEMFTQYNSDFKFSDGLEWVSHIKIDKNSKKWIATTWSGINVYDDVSFTNYNTTNSNLSSNEISELIIDSQNNIWAHSSSYGFGLYKYDGNSWSRPNDINQQLNGYHFEGLGFDTKDNILACFWEGCCTRVGLKKFINDSWIDVNISSSKLNSDHIWDIAIDSGNVSWITDGQSLLTYDKGNWSEIHISLPHDYSFDWLRSIEIDSDNNKWLIYDSFYGDDIICKFKDGIYDFWYAKDILDFKSALDLSLDTVGNLYCMGADTAGYGFAKFTEEGWKTIAELSFNYISLLLSYKIIDESNIWVGTMDYGLYHFDGTEWIQYSSDNSPIRESSRVRDIDVDKEGNLWVSNNSIIKYDGNEFTIYQAYVERNITLNESRDEIWSIGGDGIRQWVTVYNKSNPYAGEVKFFLSNDEGTLPVTDPSEVIFDNEDNFWIKTDDSGLLRSSLKYVTNVKESPNQIVDQFKLEQNYPNPFNPSTTIKYSIPKQSNVILKVFDVLGREVETLVQKIQQQGNYEVDFDGSELTSGIYFYRLQAGAFIETKKMILLK